MWFFCQIVQVALCARYYWTTTTKHRKRIVLCEARRWKKTFKVYFAAPLCSRFTMATRRQPMTTDVAYGVASAGTTTSPNANCYRSRTHPHTQSTRKPKDKQVNVTQSCQCSHVDRHRASEIERERCVQLTFMLNGINAIYRTKQNRRENQHFFFAERLACDGAKYWSPFNTHIVCECALRALFDCKM